MSLKIWVGTYIGMSYFVYSQSIGEECWEISIIFFSVDFSKRYERYGTKVTEVQHLIALSLTWLKHVHFAPNQFFRDQVMVYGITIWFARRWDCNTPVEIHQFYDCQWINLYKCMLTHYSMVTPNQLNYIPIRSWFILIHFISISAFPPESRTRKAANFPSIWY